jgi:non-ribosomal peptide synthetase component E (peptide arylation enzyme)
MDTTFFTRLQHIISSNPDKTAIVFDGEQLSYSELDKKCNALAQVLCAKGIGSGDVVPVLLERGSDTITFPEPAA